jgi:hypothetical protein
MRWRKTEDVGAHRVRAAVKDLMQSGRMDDWLVEVPDQVLIQIAAPFEMLAFQYYRDPPRDRHLVRAARVACEAVESTRDACPDDMTRAFQALRSAVSG